MPFWLPVVWSFTSTRLAEVGTPSIVCSPERVMFPVVAHATMVFGVPPDAIAMSCW